MSDLKTAGTLPQPQGIGEDPLLWTTKLFVRFLQIVFSTFEKGSFRWEPDLELTDIVIGDQSQARSEVVEKRPLIVCERGQAQWMNLSMDQFLEHDYETGARRHTDLIAAQMTYNCVAREGLEAQRIAWIASYATRTLKKSLMRAGLHRVGENVGVGPEGDAGELVQDVGKNYPMVQVSVPFFFQDTYTISPVDKLLLNGIDLRLTSQVNYPSPGAVPVLRDPALRGRALKYSNVVSLTQRVSTRAPKKK